LWAIEGFSSRVKLPVPFHPPTTHEFRPTRSAWNGSFQRLLEFNNPDCDLFFVRFKLYTGAPYRKEPDVAYTSPYAPAATSSDASNSKANGAVNGTEDAIRPLLAVGNERSRISFWDLARIANEDGTEEEPAPQRGRKPKPKAGGSVRGRRHAGTDKTSSLVASSSGPVSIADSKLLPGTEHLRSSKTEGASSGNTPAPTSAEQAQADVLLAAASSIDADDSMTGVVATSATMRDGPQVMSQTAPSTGAGNPPAPSADGAPSRSQPLGPPPVRSPATRSPVTKSPLRALAPAPPHGPREMGNTTSIPGTPSYPSYAGPSGSREVPFPALPSTPLGQPGVGAPTPPTMPQAVGSVSAPGASAPAPTPTRAAAASSTPSASAPSALNANGQAQAKPKAKDTPRSDPFTPLAAHRSFVVPKINFTIRQIAFSVGGEYMVAVGDQGVIALFQR
jgi:hypothetical protein